MTGIDQLYLWIHRQAYKNNAHILITNEFLRNKYKANGHNKENADINSNHDNGKASDKTTQAGDVHKFGYVMIKSSTKHLALAKVVVDNK